MISNRYMLAKVSCKPSDLESAVSALNYMRGKGVKIACGRSHQANSDKVEFLVACGYAGVLSESGCIDQVSEVLDNCDVSWSEVVGLCDQVRQVKRIAKTVSAFGRDSLESLNMVFVGQPGTGKTELARRFSVYCGLNGVTTGKMVIVSAADLISNHVGETPMMVRDAFDRADGGVLFIDEAYSLTMGTGNEFGVEAVNALVECMDSRRDRTMVIAAGYEKEMDDFLASNPGLRSRFPFRLEFESYGEDDLVSIFCMFAEKNRFSIDDDAHSAISRIVSSMRSADDFANARSVRNLFDRSVIAAAQSHPQLRKILAGDVDEASLEIGDVGCARRRIGFA